MIITAPIQRQIEKKLISDSSNRTAIINTALAQYYAIKTYSMILDDVIDKLNNYLNNLTVNTGIKTFEKKENNIVDLFISNNVIFKGYRCFLSVTLSGEIVIVVIRFYSVSKKLRNELNLIKSNNTDIKIHEGSGITQIGFISREHKKIDSMDANNIYDYIIELFEAIGGIDQLK